MSEPRKTTVLKHCAVVTGWLLLGSLLSISVAWVLAIVDLPALSLSPRFTKLPLNWPDTAPADWPAPETVERLTTWRHTQDWAQGMPGKATIGNNEPFDRYFLAMDVQRVGFPFPAMGFTTLLDGRQFAGPGMYREVETNLWQTGYQPKWRSSRQIGDNIHRCVIPLRPVLPGFVFNAVLYAAIAWGLWQVPLALRRWARRRAGKCVRCGYHRAGLAPGTICPECGGPA